MSNTTDTFTDNDFSVVSHTSEPISYTFAYGTDPYTVESVDVTYDHVSE